MIVYELAHTSRGGIGGQREGLFATMDLAKARAEQKVAEYRRVVEESPDDVEPMYPDPEWTMARETIGHDHEVGDPKPHLIYGTMYGSAFVIREVEVLEVP